RDAARCRRRCADRAPARARRTLHQRVAGNAGGNRATIQLAHLLGVVQILRGLAHRLGHADSILADPATPAASSRMNTHTPSPPTLAELPALIPQWARELGFSDAGISSCELDADAAHLRAWLTQSRHGDMAWMARDPAMRHTPAQLHPGTV